MPQPLDTPEKPVFRSGVQPFEAKQALYGLLAAALLFFTGFAVGEPLLWRLIAADAGLLCALSLWCYAWLGSRGIHWAFEPDGLLIWNESLVLRGEITGKLAYPNILSVEYFEGQGLGLRLRRPGDFFDSFSRPGAGESLEGRDQALRQKLGVDFFIPRWQMRPDPRRFTELLRARLPKASGNAQALAGSFGADVNAAAKSVPAAIPAPAIPPSFRPAESPVLQPKPAELPVFQPKPLPPPPPKPMEMPLSELKPLPPPPPKPMEMPLSELKPLPPPPPKAMELPVSELKPLPPPPPKPMELPVSELKPLPPPPPKPIQATPAEDLSFEDIFGDPLQPGPPPPSGGLPDLSNK